MELMEFMAWGFEEKWVTFFLSMATSSTKLRK